jgi:hypothetical protein
VRGSSLPTTGPLWPKTLPRLRVCGGLGLKSPVFCEDRCMHVYVCVSLRKCAYMRVVLEVGLCVHTARVCYCLCSKQPTKELRSTHLIGRFANQPHNWSSTNHLTDLHACLGSVALVVWAEQPIRCGGHHHPLE